MRFISHECESALASGSTAIIHWSEHVPHLDVYGLCFFWGDPACGATDVRATLPISLMFQHFEHKTNNDTECPSRDICGAWLRYMLSISGNPKWMGREDTARPQTVLSSTPSVSGASEIDSSDTCRDLRQFNLRGMLKRVEVSWDALKYKHS